METKNIDQNILVRIHNPNSVRIGNKLFESDTMYPRALRVFFLVSGSDKKSLYVGERNLANVGIGGQLLCHKAKSKSRVDFYSGANGAKTAQIHRPNPWGFLRVINKEKVWKGVNQQILCN